MSFIKLDKISKFELNNVHTSGVVENKYGGFLIPVELADNENFKKVFQLFVDHKVDTKLYGTRLFLKTKELSDENKKKLLNKGNQDICIHFERTGVYETCGKSYLLFKVTKLCKLSKPAKRESKTTEEEEDYPKPGVRLLGKIE